MLRSLLARALLVLGGAVGLGMLPDPRWGVALGAVLLAGGAGATASWFQRERTVLEVAPRLVGIDRWLLDWPAVSKIVVYDLARESTLLGVQLRSPVELPAGVPVTQLDQSVPQRPVILSGVDSDRVHLERLVAVFRRVGPPEVDLVTQAGTVETPLVTSSRVDRSGRSS